MQLTFALVINICHLIIHIYVLPFKVAVMNQLESAALLLKCILNLCGLAMNYLEVAIKASSIKEEEKAYQDQIETIQTISIICTLLILMKFGFRFGQMMLKRCTKTGRD